MVRRLSLRLRRRSLPILVALAAPTFLLQGCVPGEPEGYASRSGDLSESPGTAVGPLPAEKTRRRLRPGSAGVPEKASSPANGTPARIGGLVVFGFFPER